ncbi:MAG: hypothetical protein EB116_13030, partial [Betaproteobacteria bacterium]|nr:hypothetical protein [Betaproteobacteria bacterium]
NIQVAALSSAQVGELSTTNVQALSLNLLTSANVTGLETRDLAVLATSQLFQLTSANIVGLSTAQLSSLTTANALTLGTSGFAFFSTSALSALNVTQLASIHTSQAAHLAAATSQISSLFSAFQQIAITGLTANQTSALFNTPLVFDLDGNGIRTLSVDRGVKFDLNADGRMDQTGWVASGDGLLARDLNQDGQINDGSELFGEATKLADGSTAKDGFEALASLDSNRDGKVDAADAAFGSLRIWSDADADGHTDAGELKTLSELGITSIRVDAKAASVFDNGNFIGLSASYERADGSQGEVADVWFRVSTAEALEQKAAALGEALTQYAQGGPQGASTASGSGSGKGNTGQATVAPSATPTANANANAGNSAPGTAPAVPSNIAELGALLREQALGFSLAKLSQIPTDGLSPASLIRPDRLADKAMRDNWLASPGADLTST